MNSLRLIMLQESLNRGRETRTILALLGEEMDGVDRIRRRRSLKERLGLNSIGFCGATWGLSSTTIDVSDDEGTEEEEEQQQQQQPQQETEREEERPRPGNASDPGCEGPVVQVNSGSMNLAAALAAERHLRAEGGNVVGNDGSRDNRSRTGTVPGTPSKMSLMRLLAETDGCVREEKEGAVLGNDAVCCVCMGRKKGAAFIPCGHTFCRVCSREIWLNRGSCPLCNRSILEILDIF